MLVLVLVKQIYKNNFKESKIKECNQSQQFRQSSKKEHTVTRFHVDALDSSVFGEQTFQLRLPSLVLEVPDENGPRHRAFTNDYVRI